VVARGRDPRWARRVEPPLEVVERDDRCAGNRPVRLALLEDAQIHEEGTVLIGARGLGRRDALQLRTHTREEFVDRRHERTVTPSISWDYRDGVSEVLGPLPAAYPATRDAIHALAEHVLAATRYRATKHIGLRPTPGGVGTPPFGDDEIARVEGVELVHERAGDVHRAPITTLGAAAEFFGVPLGAPPGYTAATPGVPGAPLTVDAAAAAALAEWYAFADDRLAELRRRNEAQESTGAQLWPEHFDLAIELGSEAAGTRAGYGASPGDDAIPEPYLYVGPWDAGRRTGRFGRCPFGAALTYSELRATNDHEAAGRDFYMECAQTLLDPGAGPPG
jgi:hypothetical protein